MTRTGDPSSTALPAQRIESILCVDDDPDICQVVKSTLSLIAGLDVRTAGSGEQAIELAHRLRPALVLLDVMMPGLDGPSTLKRMREDALLADIPVIFLTAKALPGGISRLLQLGALGVLRKPFDPMKLCEELLALWKPADIERYTGVTHAVPPPVPAQPGSLADRFLGRTKLDLIRLRAIIEGHEDRSMLEEAGQIAHSIHGAGAMFGFPEVGAAGAMIESLIARLRAGSDARDSVGESSLLKQLVDSVDHLARRVNAGESTPGAGMLVQHAG